MSQENQIKHMIRLGEPSLLGEPSYAGSCPRASSVITVSANCAPWFSSLGCCVCVGGCENGGFGFVAHDLAREGGK